MCETEKISITPSAPKEELQKVASFRSIRKKILRKQLLITGASFVVIAFVIFAAIGILKSSVNVVEYHDNLSVSMVDGSLIGRLKGSQGNYLKIIRTITETDTAEKSISSIIYPTPNGTPSPPAARYSQNTPCARPTKAPN